MAHGGPDAIGFPNYAPMKHPDPNQGMTVCSLSGLHSGMGKCVVNRG